MRGLQVMVLVAAATSRAHAGNPLDKPPFTASPNELLAAARTAASDTGAVILREDEDTTYDERGRVTRHIRFVAAITSQDGVDSWSSVWRRWAPWFQDRPALRARVITPAGDVHELDPSRIDEQSGKVGLNKSVSGALNGVTAGAVVETEVTSTDREPAIGGHSISLDLGGYFPTTSTRMTITAPTALHVHVVERALPKGVHGTHAVARGRETWTYSFGPLAATVDEPQVPPDVIVQPIVAVTSAPSWSAVAKAYVAAAGVHLAVAYPAELPHGDTLETARAITSWLHHHVQYSGAALDEEPLGPIDLDAVVKRGTGNANERAALLATLLRAAGIPAELVLVNRGSEGDLDRDFPTMSVLDGVVVRARVAGAEVWIEPLERYEQLGQLPAYDQQRPALAVADAALVTTPAGTATTNTVHETRTFELAPLGFGKVREVSREGGVFESDQRQWLHEEAAGDVRKSLQRYVKDDYVGELAGYTSSDPEDFTRPFEMTLDVENSERVNTTWSAAELHLRATDATVRLPEVLRAKPDKPRVRDYLTNLVQVYEIENRIVVPDGFTMPAAAPERTREIGGVTLTERQRIDGHTYVVTFRVELAKRRFTAAEVNATRQALADLRSETTDLVFPNIAWSLTGKGRFREALGEMDRVLAAAPRNAYHHARRAQMLLLMSDGEGARREAHAAVALDPKNATMYSVLGFVLSHDLVGREWTSGHDHAGARAALEKARSLDPRHYGAIVQLEKLLERDDHGRRYEAGADLRAAAEVARVVDELSPSDENAEAVIRNLLWAGDAPAAEKAARARPESQRRNALLVAAIAMNSGADAAIHAAPANGREAALDGGAGLLMLLRRYDLMAKLFAETGSLKARPQAAALLQLRRFEAPFRPGREPKDIVIEMGLEELDHARRQIAFWDADTAKEILAAAAKSPAPTFDGMTTALMSDMLQSVMTAKVEGDATAWRVEMELFGVKEIVYLAADHGAPKVIGLPDAPSGVGRHVLRLIGKHDDAAMRLLDWIVVDAPKKAHLDKLWGGTLPRDARSLAVSAALLADDKDHNITAGKQCGVTTTDGQLLCDLMLADGYRRTARWDELLEHSAAWAARVPSWASLEPIQVRIYALEHLGRIDEAERLLDDNLGKHPGDTHLLWDRAYAAVAAHQPDEVATRGDAIAQALPNDSRTLNNVAWMKIAVGAGLDSALEQARRAAELDKRSHFVAHTLAAAETETDNLREAVQEIQHAIDLGHEDPQSSDWYVIGRIREKAGLRDDAIAAYRRVTKSESTDLVPSIYDLAIARLRALGALKK